MRKDTEARIITAAVVDQNFCSGILGPNRVNIIKRGYLGEKFELSQEDEKMLSSMGDFEKLSEFANKLIELCDQNND